MSKRGVLEILSDIKEAISRIKKYVSDLNFDQFLKDIKTQDAVVRNFEIIGEAVKLLPNSLKNNSESIPWSKVAGIRDRLIHQYFGVNYEIIWTIIEEDLTDFLHKIEDLLSKEIP
ncbi:hypothetical protein LCGC14_0919050 [marine sediment metagenome]|uniref:DUF86 domain-containing protein n=1 Tax=marine sediment metagenome TaxID=412755 RepID=A0A0F9NW65_9ZZZZ|nr:DUF86 domain-containing protein [archaeon]